MEVPVGSRPSDHEAERASNSYLMSLVALMVGLPLPVVNLIATTIFWFGNRRQPWFVRWHCTQALLSQVVFLVLNVAGVWWTWWIALGDGKISASYLSYIVTLIVFNVAELGATIYAAVRTRRGHHVQWWFFGPLTDSIVPFEPQAPQDPQARVEPVRLH